MHLGMQAQKGERKYEEIHDVRATQFNAPIYTLQSPFPQSSPYRQANAPTARPRIMKVIAECMVFALNGLLKKLKPLTGGVGGKKERLTKKGVITFDSLKPVHYVNRVLARC
jgi:hypothetical protein